MLKNFENITEELNEKETKLLPMLITSFSRYTKENPIKADSIVVRLNEFLERNHYDIKVSDARLRKMTNYIRSNGLLPLIATSNGYHVSNDVEEIQNQIDSLQQRANAILRSAEGLKKFINEDN